MSGKVGNGDSNKDTPSVTDFTSTDTIIKSDGNVQENDEGKELKGSLVPKELRRRNLVTITLIMATVMIGMKVHGETYQQWLYMRFEKQVLGANFSHLNISVRKHPCLHDENSNEKNPYTDQLNEAQKLSSQFNTYIDLMTIIPAVTTNVMFGAYSDYIGRKFFLILPMTGFLVRYFTTWAVCYFDIDVHYLFVGSLIEGSTGSFETLFFALYAYTADNTAEGKSRAFQMVFVSSSFFAASAFANLATGYAIAAFGYMWPFVIACGLAILSLLAFIFILRETLPKRKVPCITPARAVKEIFGFYFIKVENNEYKRRDYIMLCVVFLLFAMSQTFSIRSLFLLNEPFCWNSKNLGQMEAATGLIHGIYSIFALKMLKKCLSDETILVIFMIFAVASNVVYAVAQEDWHIYIALGFALLEGSVWSLIRAILSTMVPPTKRGALFASLAVLEVGAIHASSAGVSALYANTVSTWRGLAFFVIGMLGLGNIILLVAFMVRKRLVDKKKTKANTTSSGDGHSKETNEEIQMTEIEVYVAKL